MTSRQLRRATSADRRERLTVDERLQRELARIAMMFRGCAFNEVGAFAFEEFVAMLEPAMPQKSARSRPPP